MATLAGSTIASTYTYLLKMSGKSGVVSGLVKVQDGDATDSALSIGTVSIAVDATDKIFLDGGSDASIELSRKKSSCSLFASAFAFGFRQFGSCFPFSFFFGDSFG